MILNWLDFHFFFLKNKATDNSMVLYMMCLFLQTGGSVQRQQPSHSQSISSQQSSTSQAPTARPPTPPQTSAPPTQKGHYRTPAPPVAPPSIPMTGGPGPFNSSVPSNYSMGQITALPGQHSKWTDI